jgi:hypothetical protein
LTQCYGLSSSPNRDADADAEINVTSHEQMEAATDPEASGWFGAGGVFKDEIGDKCVGVYGPLNEDGADVFFKGHPYIVQEEWDNAVSGCVLPGRKLLDAGDMDAHGGALVTEIGPTGAA